MKMGVKKALENQGYGKLKRRVEISLAILILTLLIFSGYLLFVYAKPCKDHECFVNAIVECKRVSLIREDSQSSWLYTIKGPEKDSCKVEVTLLKIKHGIIDGEILQGQNMLCLVPKGSTQYPEKDISKCNGPLKQELQDIIIKRMHDYILENVGEIKEEFAEF
jgi:hypothetical protein